MIKRFVISSHLIYPRGLTYGRTPVFIGHRPDEVNVQMPTKKPRGRVLTDEQKQENGETSSFKELVEHAICGVKRCSIVKDSLRCHKLGFEDLIKEQSCGLHNFGIKPKNIALQI